VEDYEIIQLYWERSERAIPETAVKYGRYCRCIAFNILHSNEDSEECVNDTYLRVWKAIPPHKPNNFQAFIGKITRNLSLNRYEKRTAEKRGDGRTELVLEELAECIGNSENIEQITEEGLIREVINIFLKELKPETRKLFVRRYWYLSSIKEIAEEYGMTESNVAVTLFRLREKLKKTLEEEGINL